MKNRINKHPKGTTDEKLRKRVEKEYLERRERCRLVHAKLKNQINIENQHIYHKIVDCNPDDRYSEQLLGFDYKMNEGTDHDRGKR